MPEAEFFTSHSAVIGWGWQRRIHRSCALGLPLFARWNPIRAAAVFCILIIKRCAICIPSNREGGVLRTMMQARYSCGDCWWFAASWRLDSCCPRWAPSPQFGITDMADQWSKDQGGLRGRFGRAARVASVFTSQMLREAPHFRLWVSQTVAARCIRWNHGDILRCTELDQGSSIFRPWAVHSRKHVGCADSGTRGNRLASGAALSVQRGRRTSVMNG